MSKLSIYGGTGFVGGNFSRMYSDDTIVIPREQREPETDEILYFISTVDNYNVHTNITLDVETNLKVLCETLDKCRDSDVTFNFISSWFVYGDIPLPAREDSHCKPTGFYSITKRAAEDLVMSFCRTYGKNYRILRLANVMGAGDGKTSAKKNALAFMVDKMKKDEEIFLYDDGTPTRDMMHVKDTCRAIRLVCENGNLNEIYNIATGQATQIGDIIYKAKEYLKSNSPVKSREAAEFHKIVQAKDCALDASKLNALGFKPEISIDDIVEELCIN